jgi:hypothetical protein
MYAIECAPPSITTILSCVYDKSAREKRVSLMFVYNKVTLTKCVNASTL